MSLWRQVSRGLGVLTRRSAADRDLDLEVQHFVDEATAAHVARGLSPAEARRRARLEVGNATAVREQVRDGGWENAVATLLADVRFAGRMLRKSPIFTVVVVFVISLGSGAVTTIFSGMNALVLRPLPGVADPGGLVGLQPARPDGTTAEQGSYASYEFLRDRTHTLAGMAAWGRVSLTIATGGQGTTILGQMVSADYFELLGVRPALGRFFVADEHRTPASHPVIVVSHAFWTSRMGKDPAAVGRTVSVSGHPFTVVGVAPESFQGIYTGLRADAWVPLMMQPVLRPRSNLTNASWLWLFGRLEEGVSRQAAQQELSALTLARAEEIGADRARAFSSMRVAPLTGLPNGEGRALLGFMGVLLAAAALVLLIAGINVVGMLAARYVTRGRELAVRSALGAGRGRLLRQLLTEVVALFLLGAVGGFLIASIATGALEQLPLPGNVPISLELSPDWRVFAFTIALSLLAGLTFGLAPAWRASRADITSRLRDDSPGSGSRRGFLMRGLITGQLALSLVLLVAAGLFLRALDSGQRVDPGFEPAGVVTATIEPEAWGYDEPRARAFYHALRERVAALPGVSAVSYTGRMPLMMGSSPDEITTDGTTPVPVHTASVAPDYFAALRLPLLQGRDFRASDDEQGARVAVVNETLARRIWPDGSALGRVFRFRDKSTTVIGIARDAKYATLDETTPAFVYFPLAQVWQPSQILLVRAGGGPQALTFAVQQAALSIDPDLPRLRVASMTEATSIVLLPQRAAALVTGALGAVGLVLAAVGLYGLMAFSAGRRTREIGIRVALGAARSQVLGLMVRDGMRLAALGIVIGLALSIAATRLIARWLFNVNPLDAATFVAMSALFIAVALLASYLPARRAAGQDPLLALRED
jgi:putative ABC transport system permease protein